MPRFSPEYRRHLRSPEWRAFRERVQARDGYRCVRCGSRRRLEVDHLTYIRLGHERLEDCQTVCHACHGRITRQRRRTRGSGPASQALVAVVMLGLLIGLGLIVGLLR
jgi:5-methylcytosine-specific restriction enzyme A